MINEQFLIVRSAVGLAAVATNFLKNKYLSKEGENT